MLFGIVGNVEKKELKSVLLNLFEYLNQKNAGYIFDQEFMNFFSDQNHTLLKEYSRSLENIIKESDVILAFGGDGTILKTARDIGKNQKPIIGVNLGKLGFLAEISREELFHFIDDILAQKYHLEERMVIEAEILNNENKHIFGLNDVVIEKTQTSRVVTIEAFVNDEYLIKLMADGIIVSTPTGSTAYSLAANGPIVVPTSNVMIINPICPHTLTARPIIIPDNYIFRANVKSDSGKVLLTADGQVEKEIQTPFEIVIKKADYKVRLMKRLGVSYYDLLRSKLMWGKDMRIEKII